MKKFNLKKSSVMACVLLILLCGISNPYLWAAPGVREFKYGHIGAVDSVFDRFAKKFAELVEKKSKGTMKVIIYPASQLGKQMELIDLLSVGSLDFAHGAHSFMAALEKNFGVFSASFAVTSWEARVKAESEIIAPLEEKLRKNKGIHTLPGFGRTAPYYLWTRTRHILHPDELKGIKLRFWSAKSTVATWNGLGANATPIPWADVYMALSQGVVNGMGHSAIDVYEMKFYDFLKYATELDFIIGNCMKKYTNYKMYKSLSSDMQKVIDEASIEANEYYCQDKIGSSEKAKKKMEAKGIKFARPDQGPWFEKARPVLYKLEKEGLWSSGLIDKLQSPK